MACTEVLLWAIVEVDCRDPPVILLKSEVADDEEDDEPVEWLDEQEFEQPRPASKVACAEIRILDSAALQNKRDSAVAALSELANVSATRARTALRRRAWDLDAAVAELPFVSEEDSKIEQEEATHPEQAADIDPLVQFECPCCMDEVRMAETRALACGHRFCNGCWRSHVELAIREGRARRLCCMAKSCSVNVDADLVRAVVSEAFVPRFEEAMLGAFVEESKHAKWCPSAPACGCAAVVDVASSRVSEVHCTCGLDWCFRCRMPAHFPATCEMAEAWKTLMARGIAENSWLREHTKPCPKCHRRIEKVDGCDLVSCPCGQYFCWKCGGPTGLEHTWDSIAGHTCDEWRASQKQKMAGSVPLQELPHDVEGRLGVATDMHQAHVIAQETLTALAETHARAKAMLRAAEMAFSPRHLAALDAALAMLSRAKRVLAWSHVFAFFAFHSGKPTKSLPAEITGGWDSRNLSTKTLDSLAATFQAFQGRLNDALTIFSDEVSAQDQQLATWEAIDKLIAHTTTLESIVLSFYDLLHTKLIDFFPAIATTVAVPSIIIV